MLENNEWQKPIIAQEISTFPKVLSSTFDNLIKENTSVYTLTNQGEYVLNEWMFNVKKKLGNDAKVYEYFVDLRNTLNKIKDNYCDINHEIVLDYGSRCERLTNDNAMKVGMLAELAAIQIYKEITNRPDQSSLIKNVNKANWGSINALQQKMQAIRILPTYALSFEVQTKKKKTAAKLVSPGNKIENTMVKRSKIEFKFALVAAASWILAGSLYTATLLKKPEIPPQAAYKTENISYLTITPGILPEKPVYTNIPEPLEIDKRIPVNVVVDSEVKEQVEVPTANVTEQGHTVVQIEVQETNAPIAEAIPVTETMPVAEPIPPALENYSVSTGIPAAFNQNDVAWKDEFLGFTSRKFKDAGCFLTAIASAISAKEYTTPSELNALLRDNEGFDKFGNLNWSSISRIFENRMSLSKIEYLDIPMLEQNIASGDLTIVKLNSRMHWVVVHGIEALKGEYYLHISDPWGGYYTQISYSEIDTSSARLLHFNY